MVGGLIRWIFRAWTVSWLVQIVVSSLSSPSLPFWFVLTTIHVSHMWTTTVPSLPKKWPEESSGVFFLPWKKSKCTLSLLVHILGVIFILSCLPQTPRADLRDADSTPLRGLPVVSRSLHQQHSQEDDHDDDGQRTIMFINVNVDVLLLRRIRPASKWTPGTAFYLWP